MKALALLLLLAGCATDQVRVYRNGPATFITGSPWAVAAYCRAALARVDNRGGNGRGGCATWTPTTATIACAEANEPCIAHELRHVIQPEWRHE